MSADNYNVVRYDPVEKNWVVSMGFFSDETPSCKIPIHPRDERYLNKESALAAAFETWTEGGVEEASWCLGERDGEHVKGCSEPIFAEL